MLHDLILWARKRPTGFIIVRLTFELRGTPTMNPEQRATRDETHDLEMPRQGVSFLNDMLGWGRH